MGYNSKYSGEQVEGLLDKVDGISFLTESDVVNKWYNKPYFNEEAKVIELGDL